MPKYRTGKRPELDALITEKAGVGGVFSTHEAEARGISRQVLSYQEKQGRLKRLRHGVYKSAFFPSTPYDYIVGATAASPGTVVAGPSALAMQKVGHLESGNVWLRPAKGHPITSRPQGTHMIAEPVSAKETVDLGGVRAESISEAIKTTAKAGVYDEDQLAEVEEDARSKGLI